MTSQNKRVMGITFGLLLLVLIVGFGWQTFQQPAKPGYEEESKLYVDTLVPQLAAGWDANVLLSNASTELLSATPRTVFQSMCQRFSLKLGPLQKYLGSTGTVQVENSPEGQKVTAKYKARAEFAKGNGVLLLNLIRQDGQWRIHSFFMNAPALMK